MTLRIAITVDPNIPVPPRLYGGIERVVDFLARGLVARGHQVTLLAHPESSTAGALVPYGTPPHIGGRARAAELKAVGMTLLQMHNDLDVVHSFGRLAALVPILPIRKLAKVQSYQRQLVPWRSVRIASRLAGDSVIFTGCSDSVYRRDGQAADGRWVTVYNGVDLPRYTFTPTVGDDAPLLFLGRVERIKGAHNAIRIARASRRRLIIAGNRSETLEEPEYFDREIVPALRPGEVEYVGPVDDAQKNDLLGKSAALLMPIEWDEPFGIVMAEALACGTPVIGFARGSVPEVIRDGVNGYIVRTCDEAVTAVGKLNGLSRAAARADCEARFSDSVIVSAYESLYRQMSSR
jgi:glycosyltransferase involved in cell wall biosynthesis